MKKSIFLIGVLFVLTNACVEQADFKASNADSQLVVEGLITDEPGPYFVKLTRSRKPLDFSATVSVSAIRVILSDDAGNSEALQETSLGNYQTSPTGMRGMVGRSYSLRIETRDGKVYESIPDKLTKSGSIDKVYTQFVIEPQTTGPPKSRFNIFIDASVSSANESFFRWKLNAFYKVVTFPEQRTVQAGEGSISAPRPCSGYIFSAGQLSQVGPCSCCSCWPKIVDTSPIISASQIPTNGRFIGIDVGSVPVEYWTFFEKTMVEVKQLSISSLASRYWKTIVDQKEGSTSLFQPSIGKAVSNVIHKNGSDEVQGIFYAAGVNVERVFLTKDNLPQGTVLPAAPPQINESCILAFTDSSNQVPIGWQ
jgi:Domain of unknown function (DUF4249)